MKKIIIVMSLLTISITSNAQWVVSDPMHTGITSLIKLITDPSFKSIVKNIEMLQKVVGAVQQFHRGTEIIQKISKSTAKISKMSSAVSKDGHIYPAEYSLMSQDIAKMTGEGTKILQDMKTATTQSGSVLKMTDAERAKWLDETYKRVNAFESLIDGYFSRVKSMSIKRSGSKNDLNSTTKLYAFANKNQGLGYYDEVSSTIMGNGYDPNYKNDTTSALDDIANSEKAKLQAKKMQECQQNSQNYYDELEIMRLKMMNLGFWELLNEGWTIKFENIVMTRTLQSQLSGQVLSEAIKNGEEETVLNALSSSTSSYNEIREDEDTEYINPNGIKVSPEEFDIRLNMKIRELSVPFNDSLRKKWKIEECLKVAE